MFRSVEEALDYLDKLQAGAIATYQGKKRGPWEWRPNSIEDASPWYSWCEDCQTYHYARYVFGYEVTCGQIKIVAWCIDQDGNWDIAEDVSLGSLKMLPFLDAYGPRAWEESFADYLQHILETGTDPCGEFLSPPIVRCIERWRIYVFERGGFVWLMRCELLNDDNDEAAQSYRAGEDAFPDHLIGFLRLQRLADVGGYALDPDYARRVEDLDVSWQSGPHQSQYVAIIEMKREINAMGDDAMAVRLREKAREAISRLVFATS